jgi:hypothetical protein
MNIGPCVGAQPAQLHVSDHRAEMTNIVKLALFVLISSAALTAQTCAPFKYVNHRIVVQAKINGYGPFNLLLDTGTQITIIDPKVYSQVGGTVLAPASLTDGSGSHEAFYAQISTIQVAGKEDDFFKVMVYDVARVQSDHDIARTVGILGQNFLEQFTVNIDHKHSCLTLQ